ncbi:Os10g0421600 [Oryza sativa Japonica Group]|uniref:Os10g0421600 protein n=1 Tax=Oryza sativa subsp. japonica TaxID=39947 RepID=A0A0P0XUS5_ORYSJ|nr:Os10g0421600 [Oryza sativa Japonica Group]
METYQPGRCRRLAADHHRRGILAAGSASCYPYAANPYRMAPAASLLRHVGAGGGAMNTAFTETTTNGGGDASYSIGPSLSLRQHHTGVGGAGDRTTVFAGGDALAANYPYSYAIPVPYSAQGWHRIGAGGGRNTALPNFDVAPYFATADLHHIGGGGDHNTAFFPNIDDLAMNAFSLAAPNQYSAAEFYYNSAGGEQNIEEFYYNGASGVQNMVPPYMDTLTANAFSFTTPGHYSATEFYYNNADGEQNIEEFYYNAVGHEQNIVSPNMDTLTANTFSFATPIHYSAAEFYYNGASGEQNIEEFYYNGASGVQNMVPSTVDTLTANTFSFTTPGHYSATEFYYNGAGDEQNIEEFYYNGVGGEQNTVSPNMGTLTANAFSFATPAHYPAVEFYYNGVGGSRTSRNSTTMVQVVSRIWRSPPRTPMQ